MSCLSPCGVGEWEERPLAGSAMAPIWPGPCDGAGAHPQLSLWPPWACVSWQTDQVVPLAEVGPSHYLHQKWHWTASVTSALTSDF